MVSDLSLRNNLADRSATHQLQAFHLAKLLSDPGLCLTRTRLYGASEPSDYLRHSMFSPALHINLPELPALHLRPTMQLHLVPAQQVVFVLLCIDNQLVPLATA